MRWVLGNAVTEVTEATSQERHWLDGYLSFTDKVYRPSKRRFDMVRVSLFHGGTFPAGLAPAAFNAAREAGFKVEFKDGRLRPCTADPKADLEWLRHHPAVQVPITHQIEAVKAVIDNTRGVLWLPTGSGKTEIAAGIVRALPCRWLFLVHRADLLQQTVDRFERRLGERIGVIGDGRCTPQRVTVCTFQTAARMLKDARRDVLRIVDGIIVDECHAAAAQSHWEVIQACEAAYYRVGLSGTPLSRGDSRNLLVVGGLGRVIYRVLPKTLIDLGLLAQPNIHMVEVAQQCDLPTWQGVYGEAIVRSAVRNKAIVEVVQRASKPCLVFVQQVKHGKEVMRRLERTGLRVEFAWGEKATAQRSAAVERLVRRDLDAVVCNVIFQEGIDIPSLASVVIATAGKSTIAAVQRVGRGMRADAATGKREFEVWDIADAGCGCKPDDELTGEHSGCKWLNRHTQARIKAYEAEGFTVRREGRQLAIALG